MIKLEIERLGTGWVARPEGSLGNVGWYPFPWTATWGETKEKAEKLFRLLHREDQR